MKIADLKMLLWSISLKHPLLRRYLYPRVAPKSPVLPKQDEPKVTKEEEKMTAGEVMDRLVTGKNTLGSPSISASLSPSPSMSPSVSISFSPSDEPDEAI